MKSARVLASTAALLALIAGSQAFSQTVVSRSDAYMKKLTAEGERNRVLNQMEIGTLSLQDGDRGAAKQALDDALFGINAIYANNKDAEKARSMFYAEGSKLFKGEPYERAMAYMYRGLLYLQDADYENARAAFRQGLMQDAFAEEDQNRADFALLMFLDAWASHCDGALDLRDTSLEELKKFRPNFPGIKPGDDTLIFIQTGYAPRKLGDGAQHSYFVFRRGKGFTENGAQLQAGDQITPAFLMEDIYFQAATRGGREVDKILKGKAQLRNTASSANSFLLSTSNALQDSGANLGSAAYAVPAVVGILALIGNSPKAEADTRYWSTLPDAVHIMTMSSKDLPPGDLNIQFTADKTVIPELTKPLKIVKDERGRGFAFIRSR